VITNVLDTVVLKVVLFIILKFTPSKLRPPFLVYENNPPDANGELQVDVLTMPATFAEDTAHVSGNTGAFVLGVRNDLNTVMTNADGDYSPIAVNDKGAVAVSLPSEVQITPNIEISENDTATITDPVYSISFANIGTADGLISFDSGATQVNLSPGVTINMDAGGLGNFYAGAVFTWDTQTNLGSKLIITYNT